MTTIAVASLCPSSMLNKSSSTEFNFVSQRQLFGGTGGALRRLRPGGDGGVGTWGGGSWGGGGRFIVGGGGARPGLGGWYWNLPVTCKG